MKRKKFISSALALTGWGLSDLRAMDSNPIQLDDDSKIVPQPLKKGDVIAILAPAGYIEEQSAAVFSHSEVPTKSDYRIFKK